MNKAHNNNSIHFLATTAIEECWDMSKPLLFLGPWCRRFSRKSFWEPLGGEVLESPWFDKQQLYKAYQYVENVYERLVPVLGAALNSAHKVNHSPRYWRIVLGPWLQYYIPALYDRYVCLRTALDKYPDLISTILSEEKWVTPVDTLEFVQLIKEDPYNLQIYSRILRALGKNFPQKKIDVAAAAFDARVVGRTLTGPTRKALQTGISTINTILKESRPIIFRGSYFSTLVELELVAKTLGNVWPIHGRSHQFAGLGIDTSFRKNLPHLLSNNEFENLLSALLPYDLPLSFIEGLDDLRLAGTHKYPIKPKAVFSSVAWYFDEDFKQWAASASERGTLLLGMQHGGNYGSLAHHPSENHEIKITDRYFTWGWDRPDVPAKVVPWFASKLSGRKSVPADNEKEGILFVATHAPRYLFQFPHVPYRFKEYLLWQSRFLASMDTHLLAKLRVRFHREDFGWDIAEQWMSSYPAITIERWDTTLVQSLNNCRIYICDHLATTFLESLSANKPTILFWDPEINELRPEARSYYDQLLNAGILYDAPETAAEAVNASYNDVAAWWNDPPRQEARRTFCNRFARTSSNAVNEWAAEFKRISK